VEGSKSFGFTVESEGYGQYLHRRPWLPKLGWLAGLVGALVTAVTLLH
jgi:hypothetical protein